MASSRLRVNVVKGEQEADVCDSCNKVTEEVVLSLCSGARYRNDHMVQFAHPSCIRKLIEKALAA